ncbi:MAG: bifunctional homocysteine S-methyltransferase/methylenetetrahydrofolate reductase [Bacillota bacterium]|nr:bifunctional homocysteine S-methyltransferase/methylenetetrahydrofolate reductase [Bacillota bacterium]
MNIRDYIREHKLLFDGAMGTYFSQINKKRGVGCELANLSQPELIRQIHQEYIEVGCKAIKTNTFNANRFSYPDEELVEKVIRAGVENARRAIGQQEIFLFGDIGPVDGAHVFEEYKFVADLFLEAGVENFLFETLNTYKDLDKISAYIKEKNPEAYIICSFATSPEGFTKEGLYIQEIMDALKEVSTIDCLGLNCTCGSYHMNKLAEKLDVEGHTFSLMPNAGYPVVFDNRTYYDGDPAYYASQMKELAKYASILGGCCGTQPQHIKEVFAQLQEQSNDVIPSVKKEKKEIIDSVESPFWNKLQNHQKVMAVELDPPDHASLSKFMSGAWQLKGAGVDILTIADCPVGRVRMDSSLLACKIKRELSLEALPHMTCRDRNINATRALLLGIYAEGLRNVLLITGDPLPSADRNEVKTVFQFNSRKLAKYITSLSKQSMIGNLHLFGALNVNAHNFDVQLRLAKEKLENGMVGFLTQPVLTQKALDNLKRAKEELNCYILGGVIPVVSKRNALFMNNEINGIEVDPKIIDLYEGKTREECEGLAVKISVEIMKKMEDFTDGFYLMTPFGRTSLIEKIIREYNV